MRALLGLLALVLSTLALMALVVGAWVPALALLAFTAAALARLTSRGPRRVAHGLLVHFVINSLFVIGIAVCLHMLISNRLWEIDMTKGARHSLSPLTERQLRALPERVSITAISSNPQVMQAALDRLTRQSDRLQYDILHPTRDIQQISNLVSSLGLVNPQSGQVILQTRGATPRHRVLDPGDGSEFEFDEQAWINALIQLTREEQPQVHFLIGHGEKQPDLELVFLRNLLTDLAHEVSAGATSSIPEGTELVISVGPVHDFTPADIAALQRHVDAGGSALILLDPRAPVGSTLSPRLRVLEDWLATQGIDLPDGAIAEDDPFVANTMRISDHRSPSVALVNDTHPITAGLNPRATPLLLSGARPIETGEGDGERERVIETLLRTWRSHTWLTPALTPVAESEIPPEQSADRRAMTVAAATTIHMPTGTGVGRLVVVGDSDWIADPMVRNSPPLLREGAERFLRGAVGWLIQEEDLIAIPSTTPPETPISLTPPQRRLAMAIALVLLPELLLALGVWLMIARSEDERDRKLAPTIVALLIPLAIAVALCALGMGMRPLAPIALSAALLLLWTLSLIGAPGEVRRLCTRVTVALTALLVLVWSFPALRSTDAGPGSVHSASPAAMAAIDRDVTAHIIATDPSGTVQMLERLAPLTPHLRWDTLDPREDAAAITGLIQTWEITPPRDGDTLLVGGGINQGTPTGKILPANADEERWVNALLDVGQRRPIRLVVTDGHGERSLGDEMTMLRRTLAQLGIVAEQRPLEAALTPDVILIPGPLSDFSEEEIGWLDAHVDRGGGLIVLLDSPMSEALRGSSSMAIPERPERLLSWLEDRWGLEIPEAVVVDDDPQMLALGLQLSPLIRAFHPQHPVAVRTMNDIANANAPLPLREARPVFTAEGRLRSDQDVSTLFLTQETAWAETNLTALLNEQLISGQPDRLAVPLAVAAHLHGAQGGARLIVIGDSDFATDEEQIRLEDVGSSRPAQRLLRTLIGWTAPEGAHVAFADPALRVPIGDNLQIAEARRRSRAATLLGVVLLLGACVSLRRGRRGAHTFLPMAAGLVIAIPLSLSLGRDEGDVSVRSTGVEVIETPPAQVAEITIERGDQRLDAVRSGTTWRDAEGNELSSGALELLAVLLTERQRHAEQPAPSKSRLGELGLGPEEVSITVTDRDGEETVLLIGDVPPQSHRRAWAMIEGEETIFLVEDDLLTLAQRPLDRWRQGATP